MTQARSAPAWPADYLGSPEWLAEYVGVPLASIYQWNSRGTGPRRMLVGKHVRYRRADVDAWLEARTVDPPPAA